MPNQNECDHVVGIYHGNLVRKRHLNTVFTEGLDSIDVKFNYCPNCGAKIDWDKIKEELDDSNKTDE